MFSEKFQAALEAIYCHYRNSLVEESTIGISENEIEREFLHDIINNCVSVPYEKRKDITVIIESIR